MSAESRIKAAAALSLRSGTLAGTYRVISACDFASSAESAKTVGTLQIGDMVVVSKTVVVKKRGKYKDQTRLFHGRGWSSLRNDLGILCLDPVSSVHAAAEQGDVQRLHRSLSELVVPPPASAGSGQSTSSSSAGDSPSTPVASVVDELNREGLSPMMLAARKDSAECVAELLASAADPMVRDQKQQWTALEHAALCGATASVSFLAPLVLEIEGAEGLRTATELARSYRQLECLEMLTQIATAVEKRQEKSAVVLQCVVRGRRGRRLTMERKSKERYTAYWVLKESSAAVALQSRWRGKLARRAAAAARVSAAARNAELHALTAEIEQLRAAAAEAQKEAQAKEKTFARDIGRALSTGGAISKASMTASFDCAVVGMSGFDEVQKAFNQFDEDDSGSIDSSEFAALCETLGLRMSEQEVVIKLREIDTNGDGTVDLDEFQVHKDPSRCVDS